MIGDRKSCGYSLCGRTDKGVSALGNVFSITLRESPTGKYNYMKILNNQLPDDIRVVSAVKVPHHFDARFSCLYREYRYFFMKKNLNLEKMQEASRYFIGIHDFKNFCKDDTEKNRTTERRILAISVVCNGEIGEVHIKGYSFLWHQVRCMMAVLFRVGEGSEEPQIIKEMLVHSGQKPQYELASEIGLILYDCVFESVEFPIDYNDSGNSKSLGKIYEDLMIRLQIVNCVYKLFVNIQPDIRHRKKIKLK